MRHFGPHDAGFSTRSCPRTGGALSTNENPRHRRLLVTTTKWKTFETVVDPRPHILGPCKFMFFLVFNPVIPGFSCRASFLLFSSILFSPSSIHLKVPWIIVHGAGKSCCSTPLPAICMISSSFPPPPPILEPVCLLGPDQPSPVLCMS